MSPRLSSIGTKRILATWFVTKSFRMRRSKSSSPHGTKTGYVLTAFEPIKRLLQFYYQERER